MKMEKEMGLKDADTKMSKRTKNYSSHYEPGIVTKKNALTSQMFRRPTHRYIGYWEVRPI